MAEQPAHSENSSEKKLYCLICHEATVALEPDNIEHVFYKCKNGHIEKTCLTDAIDQPNIIKEPFNTIIDVTDSTPIEQIPKDYIKQKWDSDKAEIALIQQGIEGLSCDPDIETLLMDEAHQTVSKYAIIS